MKEQQNEREVKECIEEIGKELLDINELNYEMDKIWRSEYYNDYINDFGSIGYYKDSKFDYYSIGGYSL